MARVDPRVDAEKYFVEHNIKKLFRDLGTRLLFERPTDPNAYLVKILQEMKKDEKKEFFNEQDVRACFSAFDITNTGKISALQYVNALKSFGIENPTGLDPGQDSIERESFVAKVMAEVVKDAI